MKQYNYYLMFLFTFSLIIPSAMAQPTPLLKAIQQSDITIVRQLIEQGAEVNQRDKNGATPLMWAAYKSNLEMLRYLIEQGANPQQKGVIWFQEPDASFGNLTGLAAFRGDLPMLKYLIEELKISPFDRGFHPNTQAMTGWTAYEYAAMQQKREILEYLASFENPLIVLVRNHDSATEQNGQIPPLVGYLLLAPESVKAMDKMGRTALHLASQTGNLEIVKILLTRGSGLHTQDHQGQTPLHLACQTGQYETAKFLIEQGAKIDVQDKTGTTALMLAAAADHLSIVRMLYYLGANTTLKNNQNQTIMDISKGSSKQFLQTPQPDYFQLLTLGLDSLVLQDVKNGKCPISITDEQGNILLHLAATYGYVDLAEVLIEKGVDINQQAKNNSTPLMLAAHKNQLTILNFLLKKGANIHLLATNDISSLMIGALKNHLEIVETLLQNGAKINEVNQMGGSALHATIEGYVNWQLSSQKKGWTSVEWFSEKQKIADRHLKTVQLLLKYGINTALKTQAGETALDMSKLYGVEKVTELLQKHKQTPKTKKKAPVKSSKNDNGAAYKTSRIILPTGHTSSIPSIDISADNRYVLSVGVDKNLIIWDLRTGIELFRSELEAQITAAIFLPNSQKFALATNELEDNIQIWDFEADTPHLVQTLQGQSYVISSLLTSSDGRQLIASSYDGTYRVWDLATGQLLHDVQTHQQMIIQTALSSNDKYLATVSDDKSIKVWNITTNTLKQTLIGHPSNVMAVAFSPDNIHLASSDDSGHLIEWAWQTGNKTFEYQQRGSYNVAYSHHGKYLAFDAVLFDAATKKVIRKVREVEQQLNVNALRFSNDDKLLLAAGSFSNPVIKVWGVESGRVLQILKGHTEASTIIPLSNQEVLTATLRARPEQKSGLRKWNIAKGTMELKWEAQGSISLTALNLSKDKKRIALGQHYIVFAENGQKTEDFFISIKSLNQLDTTELKLKGHTARVKTLAFSSDGQYLISSGDFIPNWELMIDLGGTLPVPSFDSDIRLWDLKSGQQIKTFKGHTSTVNSLAFSPDGKYILSAGTDRTTRLWDVEAEKEIKSLELSSPAVFVNEKQVVTRGLFTPLSIWDIVEHRSQAIDIPTTSTPVMLEWSKDEQQIMVGMSSGELLLWDMKNERIQQTFEGHNNDILSICYLPEQQRWMSSSMDGTLQLWDKKASLPIATFVDIDKNDWVTITPDKFYRGSKNGSRKMKFSVGKETYTFDQFDHYFNRPDLVMKRIGLVPKSEIEWYEQGHQRRMALSGYQNFDSSSINSVPQLDIINAIDIPFETSKRNLDFHIQADGQSVPLQKIVATINDIPVKTIDLADSPSSLFEKKISLQLSKGHNLIRLFCQNEQGIESLHRTFKVFYEGDGTKPNLYLLLIGVSEHQNPMARLEYAAKDAEDLHTLFEQKQEDYQAVKVKILSNQKATLSNIRAARKYLENTHIDDKVIVFYAGHGVRNTQRELYFSTYDIDFSAPEKAGLAYQKLEELLTDIPARQKLLLIDACQAGEISKNENTDKTKSIPSETMIAKAITEETEGITFNRGLGKMPSSVQAPRSDFDLMKSIFVDLRNRTGTIVIAGAGGTQVALEGPRWKNGAFTYCLKEKLKNSKGEVTVSALQEYLERRVPELTKGKQQPVMRLEHISNDWRVW